MFIGFNNSLNLLTTIRTDEYKQLFNQKMDLFS